MAESQIVHILIKLNDNWNIWKFQMKLVLQQCDAAKINVM